MGQNDESEAQPSKDAFLAGLVQVVNTFQMEIGVTLYVNGLIISGLLCSTLTYLRAQADFISQGGPHESGDPKQQFARLFDQLADQWTQEQAAKEAASTDDDAEDATDDLSDFIHLRTATLHAPGTDAVLPPVLWRGRLEHVSGWSIGNFGPKAAPARHPGMAAFS